MNDATRPTVEVRPDFRVIGLDQTEYYSFPSVDKPFIEKVVAVYVYDYNRHVNCAEVTPSYELNYLYTTLFLTEQGHDLDPEQQDRLFQEYEGTTDADSVVYQHVRSVDARQEILEAKHLYYRYGDDLSGLNTDEADYDTREEWYDAVVEKLCDHLRGNHYI